MNLHRSRKVLAGAAAVAVASAGLVVGSSWRFTPRDTAAAAGTSTAQDLHDICAQSTGSPDAAVAAWAATCVTVAAGASPSASPTSPVPVPSSPVPTPPASSPSPSAVPAGYPSPASAGVPAGTVLTADSRCALATAGEVITTRHFTCAHEVVVTATNVTINKSQLDHGINNWTSSGGHSFTLTNSTVGPASGCDAGNQSGFGVGATDFTAVNVLIRGEADGVRVSGRSTSPILVQDSYVKVCTKTGDHSDGVQSDGNLAPTTIRHNTFDQRGQCCTTANVFWPGGGQLVLDNNLLAGGGGYSVQLDASGGAARQVVTGNRFVNAWQYGPSSSNCAAMDWSNNSVVTIDAGYAVTGTVQSSIPCA